VETPPEVREFVLGASALQPGERPLAQLRPSSRLLWAEILQAVTVVGLTLLIPFVIAESLSGLTGEPASEFAAATFGASAIGAELLFLGPRIIRAWIQVTFTEYTLTNERIYARTEFLSTDLRVIPYERVTLILVRRNLVERLFGIAQIHVRAYGDVQQQVRLRGLRDPWPFYGWARDGLRRHNTAEAVIRSD
jgi:uncharacterized membrane protein YdbT with pleckstrin-like domain